MPKSCAAEIQLTTQIDHVLGRHWAFQGRPAADHGPEMQRASRLLCDQLDALVCNEWRPLNASE